MSDNRSKARFGKVISVILEKVFTGFVSGVFVRVISRLTGDAYANTTRSAPAKAMTMAPIFLKVIGSFSRSAARIKIKMLLS